MEDKKLIAKFGEGIRKKRKELNISQENMAAIAGIDRGYYGAIERGEYNVTLKIIFKLAKALKCSPKDFFLDECFTAHLSSSEDQEASN